MPAQSVAETFKDAQNLLQGAGIETARLDALVLMEDCLRTDRALLLAHPERELLPAELTALRIRLARRYKGEPLAYIRGKAEFYGRTFKVNKHVLVPRPESEAMIDLLLGLPEAACTDIYDVGTGSGALAITAALERPQAQVHGLDIDPACLLVAEANARNLGTAVSFTQSDLLSAAVRLSSGTVLLCNLPYVPDDHPINKAAGFEPRLALFAGSDGLDLYRRLFTSIAARQDKPGHIITEALEQQQDALAALAASYSYTETAGQGLARLFTKATYYQFD